MSFSEFYFVNCITKKRILFGKLHLEIDCMTVLAAIILLPATVVCFILACVALFQKGCMWGTWRVEYRFFFFGLLYIILHPAMHCTLSCSGQGKRGPIAFWFHCGICVGRVTHLGMPWLYALLINNLWCDFICFSLIGLVCSLCFIVILFYYLIYPFSCLCQCSCYSYDWYSYFILFFIYVIVMLMLMLWC